MDVGSYNSDVGLFNGSRVIDTTIGLFSLTRNINPVQE